MTITRHELKQGKPSFLIWTLSIGFLLAVCIFLFPEMKGDMDGISKLFSSMGSFTAAFGMDKLNFGTLVGYYAIECGNVLGLGGAFYASLCAVNMLSKEEKEGTAEFLLTHPVSRVRIITEKMTAIFIQITVMNVIIYLLSIASMAAIGETIPVREINLLHLAYYLMQLELAGICFGISAFLIRGTAGAGLGIAIVSCRFPEIHNTLWLLQRSGYRNRRPSACRDGRRRDSDRRRRYPGRLSEICKKRHTLIPDHLYKCSHSTSPKRWVTRKIINTCYALSRQSIGRPLYG